MFWKASWKPCGSVFHPCYCCCNAGLKSASWGSTKPLLGDSSTLLFFLWGINRKTPLPLADDVSTKRCYRLLSFGDTRVLCPYRHGIPSGKLHIIIWPEPWSDKKGTNDCTWFWGRSRHFRWSFYVFTPYTLYVLVLIKESSFSTYDLKQREPGDSLFYTDFPFASRQNISTTTSFLNFPYGGTSFINILKWKLKWNLSPK